ncbi:MAG TPA: SH3 domain-containing protein [Romboutsia timonensis]|uniref:SH3 domain-containing protein n=1 Tax=Romboutsia timonensis TaxID=1776391 RepID=A0A921N3E5_9FIRM|nr:3D domain-containing protein [uncultured Romboutsia sp.]HJG97445.1 SH3 domain-containing protein [Romboutsia timonensis]
MIKKTVLKFLLVLTVIFTIGATSIFADSTGVVTASKLNVRKGPSTKYSRIGSFNKNKKITILGQSNNWYKVNLNGKEGWVSKKYVKVSGNSTSSSISQNSNSSSNNNVVRTVNVVATAYTGYSTTSTGQKPVWGTIAVDPKIIPYGTKVYIPQFGRTFIANNTGGAIKGNKIDIFMNTKKECYNWGRRTIEIQILG